jgi:NADPH2:quinone reductase
MAAVAVGHHAGARVLSTVRRAEDEEVARRAGADVVIRTDGVTPDEIVTAVLEVAPEGVDHIVEVAFHANIDVDHQVLRDGGSIASYATGLPRPEIPFWNLVFKNLRLFFLGSDDFPLSARREAGADLSAMLAAGWAGYTVARSFPLDEIAEAHETVEAGRGGGRILLDVTSGSR